jgi:hypothetical protein
MVGPITLLRLLPVWVWPAIQCVARMSEATSGVFAYRSRISLRSCGLLADPPSELYLSDYRITH